MSRHRAGKRPWLAAVLAVIYPGLGHLYLRRWFRALAWFLLVFLTVQITLPPSALPESGEFSIEAVLAASQALPIEATFALLVLTILNIADAYYLARQRSTEAAGRSEPMETIQDAVGDDSTGDESPDHCPHCGRTTDTDLDFCQWCGEPIDTDPA